VQRHGRGLGRHGSAGPRRRRRPVTRVLGGALDGPASFLGRYHAWRDSPRDGDSRLLHGNG
jgi:hypothetical protein